MKIKIFATLVLLVVIGLTVCPFLCSGQVAQPAFQRNLMTHASSYALTGGFVSDINNSTFTGGVILKQYGKHVKPGIRFQTQIPVNELLYFEVVSDVFLQRNTFYESKFLELGAGIGLEHKGFQISMLYQMADSNPVTKENRYDCVLLKGGFKILWNR